MTNGLFVVIPADHANQLIEAMQIVNNKLVKEGIAFIGRCAVCPGERISDTVHPDPIMQRMNIFFGSPQVFFDLAKTFGIILQKVNPQPL